MRLDFADFGTPTAANRRAIGETGVIPFVSQLLRKELDVVQPLQLATVGLLKHVALGDGALTLLCCTAST